MEKILQFTDELGPTKILHVHEPAIGHEAAGCFNRTSAGWSKLIAGNGAVFKTFSAGLIRR
jgi:hypothetical protein